MRRLLVVSTLALLAACSGTPPATAPAPRNAAFAEGLAIADRHRVAAVDRRRITHAEYWTAIAPSLRSPRFTVEEVGRSMEGRALRTVTFGSGPVRVFLWSQMHGDEATATMALADLFAWLADERPSALRDRLGAAMTITFLPMLNPDGAERFQRENAAGIDINRDARRLSTPEGRTLKAVRDRLQPDFGFNLHDQSARTRVGRTGPQAAIALLAPAVDESRRYDAVRSRARLIAATLAEALDAALPGRIAKYDDAFNPRAFGDLMQAWGTSTVLIESGALPNDPDKQQLRRWHVATIVTALDAIGTGTYAQADPTRYESLPVNTGGAYDLLVRGGQLVLPGQAPLVADVAINFDDPVARTGARVREVGDLTAAIAIDTVDARGRFVHPGIAPLPIGAAVTLTIRTGADVGSTVVTTVR